MGDDGLGLPSGWAMMDRACHQDGRWRTGLAIRMGLDGLGMPSGWATQGSRDSYRYCATISPKAEEIKADVANESPLTPASPMREARLKYLRYCAEDGPGWRALTKPATASFDENRRIRDGDARKGVGRQLQQLSCWQSIPALTSNGPVDHPIDEL